jgi:nucleotide-binding universal stress UspA family protein
MNYKILVPLDGSRQSETVLPFLRLLAAKTELTVELLRCFEPPAAIYGLADFEELAWDPLNDPKLESLMRGYLETQKKQLEGTECNLRVERGYPAATIVSRAEAHDLVVMASRGQGGFAGWLLGSVTTKVVRSNSKPVLVVGGREVDKLETFLVAMDGSEAAERALDWALELASGLGAKIILYRFLPRASSVASFESEKQEAESYLARLAEAHGRFILKTIIRQTDGPGYIAELATEFDADLVLLGSRGQRGSATRWLLGSVAEELIHHASCPVMVVP